MEREQTGNTELMEQMEKYAKLTKQMEKYAETGSIIVAFSGGADSAFLLKLACMASEKAGSLYLVYAVTVQTKLHPAGDLDMAEQMAAEMGAVHKILQFDELAETGIGMNPVNRCYLCKKGIFSKIKELAEELGAEFILEGTNEDDLHQYRPGIQALRELGIISPLAACGMKKAEIRKFAEKLAVPAADRPSSPCLATRLPYGTAINYELLEKIDEGEKYLRGLGFYNVRLRVHAFQAESKEKKMSVGKNADIGECGRKWIARIEIDREDLSKLISCREKVTEKIKQLGFIYVTLDLEGFRSGSMDEI